MNYMWEAVLRGYDQDIKSDDIRFRPARTANPYREVFFSDLNKNLITNEPIDVNIFYRYAAVFGALLYDNLDEFSELQNVLFDIVAHYLTELDLKQGLNRSEYYARFLREDIEAGLFGKDNIIKFQSFSRHEKKLVTAGLLRLYQVGMSMHLFAQLLRELYPRSIAYLDVVGEKRELLVYVGKKQAPILSGQLEFLCDMFVPADYQVRMFWNTHFGLIGTEETMGIGSIMMY